MKSITITDPALSDLFSRASYRDVFVIWGIGKLALVNLENGEKIRIAISSTYDSFVILNEKGLFTLAASDRKQWKQLLEAGE
jgi:hypothetical protein